MRVVSGQARGVRLEGPKDLTTRPTSDKIKEALFSMIAFELQDTRFLDLFSGTGGIGIEALSRGAKEAVFVEKSKVANKCILNNLEKTKLKDKATVINSSINQGLLQLGNQKRQFDIIFMDPPYKNNMINQTIELIIKNNILAPDGYIIVERANNEEIEEHKDLVIFKEKQYKVATISFLKGRKLV